MTGIYCIFISALIMGIPAYEWWAGMCRHEWRTYWFHNSRIGIGYRAYKCRKCGKMHP